MQTIKLLRQTEERKSLLIQAEELLRRTNNTNVPSQTTTASTTSTPSTSSNQESPANPSLHLNNLPESNNANFLGPNDQMRILKEQQRVIMENYEQNNNLQVSEFLSYIFYIYYCYFYVNIYSCLRTTIRSWELEQDKLNGYNQPFGETELISTFIAIFKTKKKITKKVFLFSTFCIVGTGYTMDVFVHINIKN